MHHAKEVWRPLCRVWLLAVWQWVPEDDGGVQSCTGRLRLISSLLRCIGQVSARLAPHSLDPSSFKVQSAGAVRNMVCCCAAWAGVLPSGLSWLS